MLPVLLSRYYYHAMVRPPLTPEERERGRRLGAILRQARGDRTPAEVAARSGVSLEVLRKIESGRVPTPTFFTVAALAHALDLPLDVLAGRLADAGEGTSLTA
jgi:transcriptional regulator with XRE-family HTH domain